LFIEHDVKKNNLHHNENKNTRKGVIRLVIVVVALHVAYRLPLTLLQVNKGNKHDLKS
jgi:hypothetical protein